MAAPGGGVAATFHEYSNINNSHYYHDYNNNVTQYYTPATSAAPHLMPPPPTAAASPLGPPFPLPPPPYNTNNNDNDYNNSNKKISSSSPRERVRTLFISGLPEDIKPREIYNLFRRRHGFETCQLKYTGRGHQIVAFAVFSHQQYALAAKDALNGLTFDPETGANLHIELARTNSRIKRSDDGSYGPYDKKIRGPIGGPGVHDDDGARDVKVQGSNNIKQSDAATGTSITDQDGRSNPTMGQPPGPGGNPPCSTLFIANLGPTCTEEELSQVLSRFKGFKMLKMQTKGGMPVAFVDFEDVTCSTEALNKLQDALLLSSDRGGMHLEYAKSRMRYPRQDRLVEKEMKQVFPFSFCDEA
uniref:RRM domain-containing protein n=1 Tax=Araucaria cunninghamii TaxID=56994 RepID=A0A0D6R214_ARACU